MSGADGGARDAERHDGDAWARAEVRYERLERQVSSLRGDVDALVRELHEVLSRWRAVPAAVEGLEVVTVELKTELGRLARVLGSEEPHFPAGDEQSSAAVALAAELGGRRRARP